MAMIAINILPYIPKVLLNDWLTAPTSHPAADNAITVPNMKNPAMTNTSLRCSPSREPEYPITAAIIGALQARQPIAVINPSKNPAGSTIRPNSGALKIWFIHSCII